MSSAVISGAETRFQLCSIPDTFSNISRFSIKTPLIHINKSRNNSVFKAFHAPPKNTENLYELLGISESGTIFDVKKAYKQMARKYHPDVSPPDRVGEYTTRFIMVKEAYETLSDPQSRALYDSDLAHGYDYQQRSDEWKVRWQSQLNELKKRSRDAGRRMSWGARMRSQR